MTFHDRARGSADGLAQNGDTLNVPWLDVAAMLSDVAFETDPSGRFVSFGQQSVLGFPSAQLIGRNISDLFLFRSEIASGASNFGSVFATLGRLDQIWRGVVTVERADGSLGDYQIFLGPKLPHSPNGTDAAFSGTYGQLFDLDSQELNLLKAGAGRGQTMIDPQTGVWSLASFAVETGRRFDRLDVANLPGTLLLLGFGNSRPIGRDVLAERLADELRETIRPTDILGRVNATSFGLWCDSMDNATAVKRAERFCGRLPGLLPGSPSISIGMVVRVAGNLEEPETLIGQAQAALQKAEAVAGPEGNGTWRVWAAQTFEQPIVSAES